MRQNGKILLIIVFSVFFGSTAISQTLWSEVRLNKSSVYVGEPVEVTITCYTSTWFTSGIDPGNIKVNGAFSVYFRPVSTSFQKDGKNYAGVQLIYNVFPFGEEDITFPSLEIEVETPPEGDYKGVRRKLKSAEKKISVKPAPPGFDRDQWLVTTNLQVRDRWSGNVDQVKVGDVLERRIIRTAYGTVAELIPPVAWDSITGISLYPSRSDVNNQKSKTAISAVRTESIRYLFEKEGEITIPEMVFSWYNPYQKKLYKRTLKAVKIDVQPNPDLGVLASIRDSLQVQQEQIAEEEAEDKPLTILGFPPKVFAVILLATLLAFFLLIKTMGKVLALARKRREQYRNSEAYYFNLFIRASRSKDREKIMAAMYRWIDELHLREPSIRFFINHYGSERLNKDIEKLENHSTIKLDMEEWKKARKRYSQEQRVVKNELQLGWINP